MGLNNMMFNGVSGINSMSSNMAVLGANVANVNTTSYKSAQATFYNVLTSSHGTFEVGNGSQVGTLGRDNVEAFRNFSQGDLGPTSRSTDMAISGRGFFMVNDPVDGGVMYTRDGQFQMKELAGTPEGYYNLVTPAEYKVQGYSAESIADGELVAEDILISRRSLPRATESVTLALNLNSVQENAELGDDNTPGFPDWDGTGNPPLPASAYDYHTSIKAYDDQGQGFDLDTYFNQTDDPNVFEFILGHDPSQDRRLLDEDGNRYGDADLAGAGALLYGKLTFNNVGELEGVEAWRVPADGDIVADDDNMLEPDPVSGLYSFEYNLSGVGENLVSTIDFGVPQNRGVVTSPGAAKIDRSGDGAPGASVVDSWQRIFDTDGNQVREGDQFTFSGVSSTGESVEVSYVVDYDKRVEDLMVQLEDAFDCEVTIKSGALEFESPNTGASSLAVTSISYRDAQGNAPADNPELARIFGEEGAEFTQEERLDLNPIRTTNYVSANSTLYQEQDGYALGYLQNFSVGLDGTITGTYSNGQIQEQGTVALVDFVNYDGLNPGAHNTYKPGKDVGVMTMGIGGQGQFGEVAGGFLEGSNVDLGRQFGELVMVQRFFTSNSQSIKTADEIYQTVLRMK